MSKKKVQFASTKRVVGVRWPSGSVTLIPGCVPLTAREVRKLLPWSKVKLLKRAYNRGTAGAMRGVCVVPVDWDYWIYGLK